LVADDKRQMHMVAYLKTGPTARQDGGWRHPEATLDDFLSAERYQAIARTLEAAKFDGCFFADLLGLQDIHRGSYDTVLRGGGQVSYLDPMVVLPVMAAATTRLGLGLTLSTTFHHPYHLARWLGSLDVMSGGRVAWNVVTSATDLEAKNLGMDAIPPRDQRYERAEEVLEACCALWSGWEENPFVLDKENGIFADPSKVHYANYAGRWVKTRGPLSIPRSPQGRPVLMQAGSSERGRDFAAKWAEAIFTIQNTDEDLRAFYADLKGRMAQRGRAPRDCAILAASTFVIGETESIAQERAEYLRSLVEPDVRKARYSGHLGADLSQVAGGATLHELQGNQGIRGSHAELEQTMKTKGVSLVEAASSPDGKEIVGTPSSIADRLQTLFESGACDGFVVSPTYFPGMFEQFCRSVIPELQRRGLFRKDYSGTTLRHHLTS
jgi:FMN-dependent oxidoreductase (nitrilotriacetate monooxygenase family)